MNAEIKKLKAHAEHLLDGFLGLRERYAMLDPMLFDEAVIKINGQGTMARGFLVLKRNLFMSCCQDIAKLSLDNYDTSPSIKRIVEKLQSEELLVRLEDAYSTWNVPTPESVKDPIELELLKRIDEKERKDRRIQFRQHVSTLRTKWNSFSDNSALDAFKKIRNKVSAHLDVNLVDGKYQPLDIGSLGVKWKDLRETIEAMQELIELIGFVVRDTSFAWDSLDQQLKRAAIGFWRQP